MRGIKKRRETWVSTADNNYYIESEGEIPKSYCQRCLEYGFNRLLGPRLYRKAELINGEKPRDWENWLMCSVCGTVVAVLHAKQENEITGVKDVPDSIHDPKKLTIEQFVLSRRNRINSKIKRVDRTRPPEETDPDVKPKVDSGSRLVSYETSDR